MERGKIVAIITGAISVIIALAYLILVQLLDFRGEMIPAPIQDPSQVSGWGEQSLTFVNFSPPDLELSLLVSIN